MSDSYVKKFYNNHPEKKDIVIICPICEGKYKYYNKSHHNNTKKHKLVLKCMSNKKE